MINLSSTQNVQNTTTTAKCTCEATKAGLSPLRSCSISSMARPGSRVAALLQPGHMSATQRPCEAASWHFNTIWAMMYWRPAGVGGLTAGDIARAGVCNMYGARRWRCQCSAGGCSVPRPRVTPPLSSTSLPPGHGGQAASVWAEGQTI